MVPLAVKVGVVGGQHIHQLFQFILITACGQEAGVVVQAVQPQHLQPPAQPVGKHQLLVLTDADAAERSILGAVQYQPNRAILHTDVSCLPANQKAWAAWNYQSENSREPKVCVHYLLNLLQPLPFKQPVIVSLNPLTLPDPASILGDYAYSHPVFDSAAVQAQGKLEQIQGRRQTWFAGAWTGYGFHEDGLKSGLKVAQSLMLNISSAQAA